MEKNNELWAVMPESFSKLSELFLPLNHPDSPWELVPTPRVYFSDPLEHWIEVGWEENNSYPDPDDEVIVYTRGADPDSIEVKKFTAEHVIRLCEQDEFDEFDRLEEYKKEREEKNER